MKQILTPQYPADTNCSLEQPAFLVIPGADLSSDNVHALFRREIIKEKGSRNTLFIASCGRYYFHINGFYGMGPVRSTDSRIFYDSYDLTDVLELTGNEDFKDMDIMLDEIACRTGYSKEMLSEIFDEAVEDGQSFEEAFDSIACISHEMDW